MILSEKKDIISLKSYKIINKFDRFSEGVSNDNYVANSIT
jgi:hypothetical protein